MMLMNLVLMCVMWSASTFNYYLLTFFLKYIPGNIFTNTAISNASELSAYAASGYLMNMMGVKISFFTGFLIASIGGTLLIFCFEIASAMPVFVLLAKFGVSFAFNVSYLGTPQLFPVVLTGTAFGICNIFSRFSTVLSAPVAEFTDPLPMIIFTSLTVIAGVLSLFLQVPKTEKKTEDKDLK